MEHKDDLVARLLSSVPTSFHERLKKAIAVAEKYYSDTIRLSGEPLLHHVLRSAKYYADLKVDFSGIVATLLHHKLPREAYENKEVFTDDVQFLLKNIAVVFAKAHAESIETQTIYKYILSFDDDLRVALIKIVEKYDNANTIDLLPEEIRYDVARRLLSIYAPLAEYMNLSDIKNEFETQGFRVSNPKDYEAVADYISEHEKDFTDSIAKIRTVLEEMLGIVSVKGQVWGRIKSYYSIWRKMKKYVSEGKPGDISHFKDLLAFTVMVDTVDQCYAIAYALQQYANVDKAGFEDFILSPKPNGFSELQLICRFPETPAMLIEVQILTKEMYWHNTYGPASHIAYKLVGKRITKSSTEFQWVEKLHEAINHLSKNNSLVESRPLKMHLFADKIFTFTPKNRIIELPVGATVLDFAYQVHTRIGDSAVFAKINGITCGLDTVLKNGDVIEIQTDSKKQFPTDNYLALVKTHNAISRIKAGLRRKRLA